MSSLLEAIRSSIGYLKHTFLGNQTNYGHRFIEICIACIRLLLNEGSPNNFVIF